MLKMTPSEIDPLDQQSELERDRTYGRRSVVHFEFDEQTCDNSFPSHLAVIARLCQRLAGSDSDSPLDLVSCPAPQRLTWAILNEKQRGVIIHHGTQIQGRRQEEGEFIEIFWSTVGLPLAFAECSLFGRYFLEDDYDVYLDLIVDVRSNLPAEEHTYALRDLEESMRALGFRLV